MHVCPECGKAMATGGGLEIHVEMQHAPPPAPAAESMPAQPVHAARTTFEPAPVRAATRGPSPMLWGYDPTVPLTALLVLAMLVAGIGSAVHRASSPTHQIVASASSSATRPSEETTPTTIAPVSHQTPATPAPPPPGSPAAIPPAGSQPQAAAQNSSPLDACQQLVNSLSNRNSRRTVDIGQLMRANAFPPLPLAGFEHPQVTDLGHYASLQEYLDDTRDPSDPTDGQWTQLLSQNGFVSADYVEFVDNDSSYGAFVFRFATATGARAFNRGTLQAECGAGDLQNPHVVPALTGGVTYLITDGPPFRVSFVAGDTVVRLHICHCVQAPDDQVLAGQWAQAVASAAGAG